MCNGVVLIFELFKGLVPPPPILFKLTTITKNACKFLAQSNNCKATRIDIEILVQKYLLNIFSDKTFLSLI